MAKGLNLDKIGLTWLELGIAGLLILAILVTFLAAFRPYFTIEPETEARDLDEQQQILFAIQAYQSERGTMPAELVGPLAETQIGTAITGCEITNGGCATEKRTCLNLTEMLSETNATPSLTSSLRETLQATRSGYTITIDENQVITIKTCNSAP